MQSPWILTFTELLISVTCEEWDWLRVRPRQLFYSGHEQLTHPQSPPLALGETVLIESLDLDILGMTFDAIITFEKQNVWKTFSFQIIFSKARYHEELMQRYFDLLLLVRCFLGFVLRVLEYCSFDRTLGYWTCLVSCSSFLADGELECNLFEFLSVTSIVYSVQDQVCDQIKMH